MRQTENFQIKSFDSEFSDKDLKRNNIIFSNRQKLQSSERELKNQNIEKNSSLNFSDTNKNTTTFSQDTNNISTLSLVKTEYLYNNDFDIIGKPSKIGKTRVCLYIKNYPIISIGKNFCYPLLLILFVSFSYLIIRIFLFNESQNSLTKLFNYFFVVYLISHILAIFINPGIPSFNYHQISLHNLKENQSNKFNYSKCKKCNLCYRLKDNIGHCKECNICYFGYERHCFWIGHCIGKYNKYFFICFVISLFTFIMISLTMIMIKILKEYYFKKI
jgi:hypothetical protein